MFVVCWMDVYFGIFIFFIFFAFLQRKKKEKEGGRERPQRDAFPCVRERGERGNSSALGSFVCRVGKGGGRKRTTEREDVTHLRLSCCLRLSRNGVRTTTRPLFFLFSVKNARSVASGFKIYLTAAKKESLSSFPFAFVGARAFLSFAKMNFSS